MKQSYRLAAMSMVLALAGVAGCYEKATVHGIGGDKEINPRDLEKSQAKQEQVNPLIGQWVQEVAEGTKAWTLTFGRDNAFTAKDAQGKVRITGTYQYANGGQLVRFTSDGGSPIDPKAVGYYELRYSPTRIELQVRSDQSAQRAEQWAFAWTRKE